MYDKVECFFSFRQRRHLLSDLIWMKWVFHFNYHFPLLDFDEHDELTRDSINRFKNKTIECCIKRGKKNASKNVFVHLNSIWLLSPIKKIIHKKPKLIRKIALRHGVPIENSRISCDFTDSLPWPLSFQMFYLWNVVHTTHTIWFHIPCSFESMANRWKRALFYHVQ